VLRFLQLSPTGAGGDKPKPHAFSLIAGKKQVMAHRLLQLGILPDPRHQTGLGVGICAEQKMAQFMCDYASEQFAGRNGS
jgi:hypothetical protein